MKNGENRQIMGLVIAAIVLVAMFFVPETANLSVAGIRTIGLCLAFLVVLVSEALPISIISWTFVALMPLLGAASTFGEALSGFSSSVVFFILASLGIAAGFTAVPLSKRILAKLLHVFGRNIGSMILATMICNAVISSVVSSVATCALFMAIGLSFLKLYENEDEKRRTGKALMISVPIAAVVGGMMTPAGSSINLIAISQLELLTGQTITFVQWMMVGIPLTLVTIPCAWFLIVKVYKPAEIKYELVQSFIKNMDISPKISPAEIRVLVVTGVMMVFWVLSSWYRGISVAVVAVLGCATLFLPKFGVLEWKSFAKQTNFDPFFLVGTVLCLGNAMQRNGVSDWIATLLPTSGMSPVILVGFGALVIFLMLIVIPAAPSIVTFMASPFIAMAAGMGHSLPMIILTLGLATSNCYLLPLDTVPLITYGTGYYSMTDMAKSTGFLQLILVVVMALWIPFACGLMGI